MHTIDYNKYINRKSQFNIGDTVCFVDIYYWAADDRRHASITVAEVVGFAHIKEAVDRPPRDKVIVSNRTKFEGPTRYVDEKILFGSREEAIWDLVHNPLNYNLNTDEARELALSLL